MAFEPTYTTAAAATEFLGYGESEAVTNEELRKAELDTDNRITGSLALIEPAAGSNRQPLRLDPETMTYTKRTLLARAVACQVRYRRLNSVEGDESFFAGDSYSEVSGPGFSHKGKLSKYSPEGVKYLEQADLIVRVSTGTSTSSYTDADLRDLYFGKL